MKKTSININNKIRSIRGVHVVLDRDLAELYEVKAIRLREQVKRNIKRFPSDFMFRLNAQEVEFLVSQNAIPSKQHLGGYLPYAFTEHGVANLSSVLNNEKAIKVNIHIIRAFIAMRKIIGSNLNVFHRLDKVEYKQLDYDKKFEDIFNAIQCKNILPDKGIFFDGQMFDAYRFVSEIINKAEKSIILIDNYVDDSVLVLLGKRRIGVSAVIYTKKISKQLALDIEKYNSQYAAIDIREFGQSHDRFLIIDDEVYHFGASLKDLGKKWFAFSKFNINTMEMLERIELKK